MKSPKGFGKVYFTSANILAYSVQNIIESITVKTNCLMEDHFTKEETEEDDPPLEPLTLCEINKKPCHCNYFYKLKTSGLVG